MTGDYDMPKHAVIIAGGEGTRLRPLTYEIPKPLIPVKGKPIVEYMVRDLAKNGVNEVVLAIGYKADMIMDYFKDGAGYGIKISYSVENEIMGTGGAAKKAIEEHFIKKMHGRDDGAELGDFLVVNGDNLYDINLKAMYRLHKAENAVVTILVKEVNDVTGYGVVTLEGNVIRKFVEKPDPEKAESHMINAGVYMLSAKALDMMPKRKKFSMEREFFQEIVDNEKMCAYVTDGQWFPADTLDRYEKAIMGWKPPST